MSVEYVSGQPIRITRDTQPADHSRGVWSRWQSLRRDMLRHIHECDRLGAPLTLDKLAEDLDEALGLVERRALELRSLRLIHWDQDRRIELGATPQRLCG